jgi:hypothetical protein
VGKRLRSNVLLLAAAIAACFAIHLDAFTTLGGYTWAVRPVTYYLNPTNLDGLSATAIEGALATGANSWAQQSRASFSFAYGGRSTQTTTTYDSVNLVVFRNASSGSAIATTYSWFSGSQIIDADIVFWDGGFMFFTGSSGCSGGFYVEDIAAHEFGHALGLGHSTSTSATMYPSVSTCATGNRTLDADDIAGVESLYPPTLVPPAPPTGVHIVS